MYCLKCGSDLKELRKAKSEKIIDYCCLKGHIIRLGILGWEPLFGSNKIYTLLSKKIADKTWDNQK